MKLKTKIKAGKALRQPQPHRSLTLLGHAPIPRNEVMPESFKRPNRKGESYEAQDQTQGRKARREPQHHRSLIVLGHVPGHAAKLRSCPESTQHPNTKENRMKLKTKIKAGKLAANHNTIVR